MKNTKLFILLSFVGAVSAHPQGLLDRFVYKPVEKQVGMLPRIVKTFLPGENALIDMLPEYKLAKIPLPKGEHTHITTGTVAKVAAFLGALKLNINEALVNRAQKMSNGAVTRKQVRNRVLLQTGLDVVKDYAVDVVQDKITDNLPESITERKVHPVIKWAAAQAGNAALGVAYDATAGRVIKAGFKHFGVKI